MPHTTPRVVPSRLVRSGGAIVWRFKDTRRHPRIGDVIAAEDIDVLLVHRPTFDDWSWPKGKMESRESLPVAAIREVQEETGYAIYLHAPLTTQRYRLGGGHIKEVHYWVGTIADQLEPISPARLRPLMAPASAKEIDRAQWMTPAQADRMLNRRGDRRLLAELLQRAERGTLVTATIALTRHGDTVPRDDWALSLAGGFDAAHCETPMTTRPFAHSTHDQQAPRPDEASADDADELLVGGEAEAALAEASSPAAPAVAGSEVIPSEASAPSTRGEASQIVDEVELPHDEEDQVAASQSTSTPAATAADVSARADSTPGDTAVEPARPAPSPATMAAMLGKKKASEETREMATQRLRQDLSQLFAPARRALEETASDGDSAEHPHVDGTLGINAMLDAVAARKAAAASEAGADDVDASDMVDEVAPELTPEQEAARPLNRQGHMQASEIGALLSAYGVTRVMSSPQPRALTTVAPYAAQLGVPAQHLPQLGVEEMAKDSKPGAQIIERALQDSSEETEPSATVFSVHQAEDTIAELVEPLYQAALPAMRSSFPRTAPWLALGETLVAHVAQLDGQASVIGVERHSAPRTTR